MASSRLLQPCIPPVTIPDLDPSKTDVLDLHIQRPKQNSQMSRWPHMKHCSNRNANHFAECHLKPPRMRVWCIGTFVTQARQLYDCISNDHAYLSTMRFETVITYTRIPLLTFHPPRFAFGQLPFRLTKNSCPRHTKMLLRFVNRPRRSTYHHAQRHH